MALRLGEDVSQRCSSMGMRCLMLAAIVLEPARQLSPATASQSATLSHEGLMN